MQNTFVYYVEHLSCNRLSYRVESRLSAKVLRHRSRNSPHRIGSATGAQERAQSELLGSPTKHRAVSSSATMFGSPLASLWLPYLLLSVCPGRCCDLSQARKMCSLSQLPRMQLRWLSARGVRALEQGSVQGYLASLPEPWFTLTAHTGRLPILSVADDTHVQACCEFVQLHVSAVDYVTLPVFQNLKCRHSLPSPVFTDRASSWRLYWLSSCKLLASKDTSSLVRRADHRYSSPTSRLRTSASIAYMR